MSYIASINIESVFHSLAPEEEYRAFDGICLTDTFQLGEKGSDENLFSEQFPTNSKRVMAQKKCPITVIVGNPPYSIGQKSANDNAQNQSYPLLEDKIANTYVKDSSATSVKAVYDSYIKAFRWATDRLNEQQGGVIGFVTNGQWIDGNGMDGMRKCFEQEFSSIYVFNLRGNQRTSGELSRKEGGKIFGSGSRTPVAITILVKNKADDTKKAQIHYYDIGDYLSREDKLHIIRQFGSIRNISWNILQPNEYGDWINHRNEMFKQFIPIEPEKKFDGKSKSFFVTYSLGIASARDSWVYNYAKESVTYNMRRTIAFYNQQREALVSKQISTLSYDSTKISWNDSLINNCVNNKTLKFDEQNIVKGLYRPFQQMCLYFDSSFGFRMSS